MLTYPLFIDELRALRADIDNLRQEPGLSESVPFRTWRHALSTLLDQMRRNGYPHISCNVQLRSFRPHGDWSTQHPANYFHSALHDTVIELDNLISNYDKYGDPKPPAVVEPSTPLAAPSPAFATLPKPGEVTWAWVRTNVPLSYWNLAAGIVIAVAVLAFGAGRLYEGFASKVDSSVANGSSTKLQPAAAAVAPAPVERKISAVRP